MTKERRREYDLIRAVSTLIIVLFHYSYSFVQYGVGGDHIYFMMHANGTWGSIFVSLFFMLSGASLYYNWQGRLGSIRGKGGVLEFWKKRWLSIFPMFYVGWFVFYMMNVISFGWLWNWGGARRKLLLTLFGIDGYFLYRDINYYTIGEWFLGAIIMLYLLYPLLQKCMEKIPVISTVIVLALFALNTGRRLIPFFASYNEHILISDNINIITCLLSFWIGMLLSKAGRRIIKAWPVALVYIVIVSVVPIPVSTLIITPLIAAGYYLIFSRISMLIDTARTNGEEDKDSGKGSAEKKKAIGVYDRIVGFFSKYSYPIFLVHHVLVQKGMALFQGGEMSFLPSILYFLLILAVISLTAFILSYITSIIMKGISAVMAGIKGRLPAG